MEILMILKYIKSALERAEDVPAVSNPTALMGLFNSFRTFDEQPQRFKIVHSSVQNLFYQQF